MITKYTLYFVHGDADLEVIATFGKLFWELVKFEVLSLVSNDYYRIKGATEERNQIQAWQAQY